MQSGSRTYVASGHDRSARGRGDAGVTPAPQLYSLRMQAEPDSVPLGANLSLTLAAFSAGFSKDQGVLGWAPRYKTPF